MASTVAIEAPVNKIVEKVYFKKIHNGKDNKYGVGLPNKSVATCQKCDKKFHIERNFKSNRNGYDGGLSKILTR